jgi:membrane-bound lytic murein transglycosylase A
MRLFAPFLLALATGSTAVPASFGDEGDRESLLLAIDRQTAYLEGLKKTDVPFGTASVPVDRLRRTNREFGKLVREAWGTAEFGKRLTDRFEPVDAGPTHFTGYYMPKLEARSAPDATFRYPLYRKPSGTSLPTHAEIEDNGALASQSLEVAWVSDEFERYILMVQGSGVLRFEDGRERFINYGGKNGHPYVSLGKALIADGKLATGSVSIPAIKRYFSQFPEQQHGYLIRNPSYVFFQLMDEGPFGVDSIQLTGRRSIATDKRFWPSGGIAYIRYPKVASWRGGQPAGWAEGGRFVCDQDTGGAIRGIGRVDIFWGAGDEAAAIAGSLNATGSLTYFLAK